MFTSFDCRLYTVPKPRWQDNSGGASEEPGGTKKATMMSSTRWVLLCLGFAFALGFPEGPHKLEARKEAECRRKERMGTVPLSEFSVHRASETGVGGYFLVVASD